MKKYTKSIVAFLLAFVLIVSSGLPIFAVEKDALGQPLVYSKEYNSGERGVVCTTLNGTSAVSYYIGNYTYDALDDLSSSDLLSSLRKLMTDTHTYKSTYDDCHYMADQTDCENEAGKNISNEKDKTLVLLYTSYTATQGQWNGWNREHVWPKSLGGNNDDDRGGGADLHHIRPSDQGVNSSRGNKLYGESGENPTSKEGSDPAVGVLGGTYNSTYFEPLDNVKGDVARICLYVWVRWGSAWGANNITQVFQSVDVLLEWCKLDPVDTWEMGRNEVVGAIQGNRNVFIDYPELAWLLFGEEIPINMKTPSGEAAKQPCSHTNTKITGDVLATCSKTGYTGDVCCVKCEKIITEGKSIPVTDNHSYGTTKVITEPTDIKEGLGKQTCKNCDATKEVVIPSLCSDADLTLRILISNIETDQEKILLLLALGVADKAMLQELSK